MSDWFDKMLLFGIFGLCMISATYGVVNTGEYGVTEQRAGYVIIGISFGIAFCALIYAVSEYVKNREVKG